MKWNHVLITIGENKSVKSMVLESVWASSAISLEATASYKILYKTLHWNIIPKPFITASDGSKTAIKPIQWINQIVSV